MPRWRNWQTHRLEGPAAARLCGFDPRFGHQEYFSNELRLWRNRQTRWPQKPVSPGRVSSRLTERTTIRRTGKWRNWQTRQIQNLETTHRAGSIPALPTKTHRRSNSIGGFAKSKPNSLGPGLHRFDPSFRYSSEKLSSSFRLRVGVHPGFLVRFYRGFESFQAGSNCPLSTFKLRRKEPHADRKIVWRKWRSFFHGSGPYLLKSPVRCSRRMDAGSPAAPRPAQMEDAGMASSGCRALRVGEEFSFSNTRGRIAQSGRAESS